jgi:hypothetical protein
MHIKNMNPIELTFGRIFLFVRQRLVWRPWISWMTSVSKRRHNGKRLSERLQMVKIENY